ncbi:MAG: hypothetical protein HDS57_01705 [Barnesiella sp.]|nr:hypothetical protein [Barnesiella sp.]MBD5374380.1 hypothetical protein [Bacteroides sp.]MDE7460253.1 hypothetical protein [Paramuribaculum sp.]
MDYIDSERIEAIRRIRGEINALRGYEEYLARPLLTSYGELDRVFESFVTVTNQDCSGRSWIAVSARKKFIFIAAYIFAPGMILGDCMPKKLRMALARVLKVQSLTSISNNWSDALFFYKNYKDFREEVEVISQGIFQLLGIGDEN